MESSSQANNNIDALTEALARIEHERWAHWQRYMHSCCEVIDDTGSLLIPAHLVDRWKRQIETPYEYLSEAEKESDREQVRRYLPLVLKFASESERTDG